MLLQFLINGMISGGLIAIMAIGFWFVYRAVNLFHIAHGAIYTASAYGFYSLYMTRGMSLPLAVIISLGISAVLGLCTYFLAYQPLERCHASDGVKFISSLAIYILVVNLIAMVYGNETKILSEGTGDSISFGEIILTPIQGWQFCSFLGLFFFSYVVVHWIKAGRIIRAIGDNPALFKAIGLSEKWAKGMAFAIGSAFAACASILSGLDVGIDPQMGMLVLLNSVVAVIIGGVKRLEGVVFGGLLIGVIQNLVVWRFSARWESAVTFLVLMSVLLYKSGGLFMIKRRVEEL